MSVDNSRLMLAMASTRMVSPVLSHGSSSSSSSEGPMSPEAAVVQEPWKHSFDHVSRPIRAFPGRVLLDASKRTMSDSEIMLPKQPTHNTAQCCGTKAADFRRERAIRAVRMARKRTHLKLLAPSAVAPVTSGILPQLRLLSATRCAPTGWSELACTPCWSGVLGTFDEQSSPPCAPEQQRYAPIAASRIPTAMPQYQHSLSPKSTLSAVLNISHLPVKTPTASAESDYFVNWEAHFPASIKASL